MSRLRIALPILISSISIPTLAHSTDHCTYASWHTPQCEAERTQVFERARNAEIEASLARVKAERARAFAVARNIEINMSMARVEDERARQLAIRLTHCKTPDSTTPRCMAERAHEVASSLTHCKSPNSTTPRCQAERAREFAAARNAEIDASMARVTAERKRQLALRLTHCKTPDSTTPRCEAERAREFAAARNAEIEASIARVEAERERSRDLALRLTHCKTPDSTTPRCEAERAREFASARNAEIEASIARVAAERERSRDFALRLTHCKTPDSTTPRCEAERAREFAAARNAEIEASIAKVQAVRAVEMAHNELISRSLAAAKAERERKFEIARNAEIDASMDRVAEARATGEIVAYYDMPPLETGAINLSDVTSRFDAEPVVHSASVMKPCHEARYLAAPLQFSNASTTIDEDMMARLDRLASIARSCPAIRIEVHGHADSSGPVQINRAIADRRATAAADYLAAAGVARSRLTAIGHGTQERIMPIYTEADRAVNRRVEIEILDPGMSEVAQRIMGDLAALLDPEYTPQLARLTP